MGRKANQGSFKPGHHIGRGKGSRNKRSLALLERLEADGYDPDLLVRVCLDIAGNRKAKRGERIYAAATGLPYLFAKLTSVAMDLRASGSLIEPKDRKAARAVLEAILGDES